MEPIINRPSPLFLSDLDIADMYSSSHIPNMEFLLSPPDSESQDSYTQGTTSMGSPDVSIQAMSPRSNDSIIISEKSKPVLKIIEQPVEKFRFRYKSEMAGTHGCLNGRNSEKTRKVTYPTVELLNFKKPAIIRCSLYSADDNIENRTIHAHKLMHDEQIDPHDKEVGPSLGYKAIFSNMGIIHTAKRDLTNELKDKRCRLFVEQNKLKSAKDIKPSDKLEIHKQVESVIRTLKMNTVTLCFEGFERQPDGSLKPICDKVFSKPIKNSKSAMTGELKICRMSSYVSSCNGDEEIFLFVEKVVRKNIKVRFFELDEDGEEIWKDWGIFTDLDVHHQFAIVLRTPPYKDRNIKKKVNVFIELFRPSDSDRSEPLPFQYKPDPKKVGTKRRRLSNDNFCSLESSLCESGDILTGPDCMDEISNTANGIASAEFDNFLHELFLSGDMEDPSFDDIRPDGPKMKSLTKSKTTIHENKKETNQYYNVKLPEVDNNQFVNKIVQDIKQIIMGTHSDLTICNKFKIITKEGGNNVLHMAINNNQLESAKFLIDILYQYGTNDLVNMCNDAGETALHRAVNFAYNDIIKLLIQIKANPNIVNQNGETPFHIAFNCSESVDIQTELITELLKTRLTIVPNIENDDGFTPIHLSVKKNNLKTTKKLIENGADINHICPKNGDSALHMIVQNKNLPILKYILKNTNVNINQQNFAGYTALHKAVANESKEICALLCQYNADPNISNNYDVEIKEEESNSDDESMYEKSGITATQLALHNPNLLDILKTEYPSPSSDSVTIKTEEMDISDDGQLLITFEEIYLDEFSKICDKDESWIRLAKILNSEKYIPIYKQSFSPTKAVFLNQKDKLSSAILINFLSNLEKESTDTNEMINFLQGRND